jgi:hypothetical protein
MSFSSSAPSLKFNFDYDEKKQTLNGVPLWMLFIDKVCHSKGPMVFDVAGFKEAPQEGYNAAMSRAFDYVLTNIKKKLDAEEFKDIHHKCVDLVKNVGSTAREFNPGGYSIIPANASKEARKEWKSDHLIETRQDMRAGDAFLSWSFGSPWGGIMISSNFEKMKPEKISEKVNTLFNEYYDEINKAKTNEEKLNAIVCLCRKLEIAHFFPDGNQRTIVFVILNKLLIENDLPPAILDDPFVFDGYLSKNQLVQAVINGQNYFLECSKKNTEDSRNILSSTSMMQKTGIAISATEPVNANTKAKSIVTDQGLALEKSQDNPTPKASNPDLAASVLIDNKQFKK